MHKWYITIEYRSVPKCLSAYGKEACGVRSLLARHARKASTEANMKTLNPIPSYLAAAAAVAVIRFPIMSGPVGWHERLLDPATFLIALTFAGVAMVLWPLGTERASES